MISPLSDDPQPPVPGAPRRKRKFLVVAATAGLLISLVVTWRWNLLRPENCLLRGRQALAAGNRQAAMRESRRLLVTPGFEPHGRLLAGLALADEGRHLDALQELQHAAWDNATAVEALTAAAGCYYALGQYDQAVKLARSAVSRDAEALDARRWLAAALYDLGLTTAAASELQFVSSRAADDFRADRLLGLIYKDNEGFQEAITHYRESLRRNPQQPDREQVRLELAESLAKLGRFEESLEALRDCELTAAVLTVSAECERGLGRSDDAERHVHEALQLDPANLPARLEHGTLLLLLRRPEEAAGVLEDAARQAPYSSQVHYLLSSALARLGNRERAEVEMQLFHAAQTREREFFELHETASKSPRDADVRYRLGVLAGQIGKAELAPMWFRAALAIKPDHAGARAALDRQDGGE